MSAAIASVPGNAQASKQLPISERGPAPRRVVVSYGFWLFLLSDIIMFAALFAAYAVLARQTNGGPGGGALFDRRHTLIETGCLLASSGTCGLMTLALTFRQRGYAYAAAFATLLLGAAFLVLEASEFGGLLVAGHGPQQSAFLSAFFGLVGLHGIHVATGLVWLLVMTLQLATLGLSELVVGRMLCIALFWHALDIVWIGVFTIVYLGAG